MDIGRFKHPGYVVVFFVLVALFSSGLSGLGTEGITFAMFIAGGTVVLVPLGLRGLKRRWVAMLDGEHSRLDYLAAPAGYRRDRRTETEQEQIDRSVVQGTPNRPLRPGDVVEAIPSRKPTVLKGPAWQLKGERTLYMAPDFNPPVDMILGRNILGVGMRGSGKTVLAARLIEQIGRWPAVPMLVGDREADYDSLADLLTRVVIAGHPEWSGQGHYERYWQVNLENARQVGVTLMESVCQVIFQMHSYPTLDEAAATFALIIEGLFAWANEQEQRIPALVFLDEAQQFLPEAGAPTTISKEVTQRLTALFENLNSIGRKRGLTPCLFTQRIAQIDKSVIGGTEIYFMGLQTMDTDLGRYEEIVGKKLLDRKRVQSLKPGQFLVYEGGELFETQIYNRDTEHRGKTPTLDDAMERFGDGEDFSLESRSAADLRDVHTEELDVKDGDSTVTNRSSVENAAVPKVKETGPRADDIPLDTLIQLWNNGANSDKKLEKALGFTNHQAQKARRRIEEAIPKNNEALA